MEASGHIRDIVQKREQLRLEDDEIELPQFGLMGNRDG